MAVRSLLVLLCLGAFTGKAQLYAPVQAGVKRYFLNDDGYLRGIGVDSVTGAGGVTSYHFFKTVRGANWSAMDTNGASWLGSAALEYPNGDWQFSNRSGRALILKPQAPVGTSWTFCSDTLGRTYEALVVAVDTQTVFGALDSVKVVTLVAKSAQGQVLADSVNNWQLRLSKAHGFAAVFDFYQFPYRNTAGVQAFPSGDFWLNRAASYGRLYPYSLKELKFTAVTDWNPTKRTVYDFEVGDVFEYQYEYGMTTVGPSIRLDSVLAHGTVGTETVDSIRRRSVYQVYDASRNKTYWASSAMTYAVISDASLLLDTARLPEEFPNATLVYYRKDDTSFCMASPQWWVVSGVLSKGYGSGLIYPQSSGYKAGFGCVYYNYPNGDMMPNYQYLVFSRKNGVACRAFVVPPLQVLPASKAVFKCYPQPASDKMICEATGLPPFRLTWTAADGRWLRSESFNTRTFTVPTSELPAGLYLLHVTDAAGSAETHRVVVAH